MQNNPNLDGQISVWQNQRRDADEDPKDWLDFRQHTIRIGAPDPGSTVPGSYRQLFDVV